MIKTTILSGTEQKVEFSGNHTHYWVQNLSDSDVFASLSSGITEGADNVLTIPAGGVSYVRDDKGASSVYLLGTGKVQIYGKSNEFCPFKSASGGGDIDTTATGNPVEMNGLQEGIPFSGITVSGRNLFPITETGGTKNGITWVNNGDGSITLNGTATTGTFLTLDNDSFIKYKTGVRYAITHNCEPIETNDWYIYVAIYDTPTHMKASWNSYSHHSINFGMPSRIAKDGYFKGAKMYINANVTFDNFTIKPQLEEGNTVGEFVKSIVGNTLTLTVNGADYTITPDSPVYSVPNEIVQTTGANTLSVTGDGEPTLTVTGAKKSAALSRVWDKLNELTTAIIVSNGEE